MGLFEEAGKRFEQFKQEAASAAEEQADYACEACDERFYTAQDACPECGADAVVPIESDEEPDADTIDEPADGTGEGAKNTPIDDASGDDRPESDT